MTQLIKANWSGLGFVIFCDVLTVMAHYKYPRSLNFNSPLFKNLIDLEEQLLMRATRHDPEQLATLLHERFSEVGASGQTYDRGQIINLLASEQSDGPQLRVEHAEATQLAENLVLLRWQITRMRPSHRTSLWMHEHGRWQLFFHQGTLSARRSPSEPTAQLARGSDFAEVGEFCVRDLIPADADAVFEAFSSSPDMSRQGDAHTADKARNYVDALLADPQQHCPLAITEKDRLIGLVCVTFDATNKSAWIWYWMHREYRGQNLTTRAVATLVEHLFSDCGMYRLELGLRANNPSSRQVAEANGFVREGIERGKFLIDGQRVDVFTYARLVTDPASYLVPLPRQPKHSSPLIKEKSRNP